MERAAAEAADEVRPTEACPGVGGSWTWWCSGRGLAGLAVIVTALASGPDLSAQGPQMGRVMREKLQHAQAILGAVVTSDWKTLEARTRALEQLTEDPRWRVLKSPEYSSQSAAFVAALQALRGVAAERDSGKATDAYVAVVTRCVDCHRYIARARIAR